MISTTPLTEFNRALLKAEFSVIYGKYPQCQMECSFYGPFIFCRDTESIEKPIVVFLPQWEISIQTKEKESLLNFIPDDSNLFSHLVLKSSNSNLIQEAYDVSIRNKPILRDNFYGPEDYSISYLKDNSFVPCKLVVTNTEIVLQTNNAKIFQTSRIPPPVVVPSPGETQIIQIQRNGIAQAILLTQDESSFRSIIVHLNSLPPKQVQTHSIVIEEDLIPDIEVSFLSNVASVADTSMSLFRHISTMIGSNSNTNSSNFQSKFAQPSSFVDMTDSSAFETKMNQKLLALQRKPTYENTEDVDSNFKDITNAYLISKNAFAEGMEYPILKIPDTDESTPPIKIARMPVTDSFTHKTLKLNMEPPMTLAKELSLSDAVIAISSQIDLTEVEFLVQPPEESEYESMISFIRSCSPSQRPIIAASVFLHSPEFSIVSLCNSLSSLEFPVSDINKLLNFYSFMNVEECLKFFTKLFERDLAKLFFESLESFYSFRNHFYRSDSVMRCDTFCLNISELFNGPNTDLAVSKTLLPFPVSGIHLRIINNTQLFLSHQVDFAFDHQGESNDMVHLLATIFLDVCLMLSLNGLQKGQIDLMWANMVAINTKIADPSFTTFESINEMDCQPGEKIMSFFVEAITSTQLLKWVLSYMVKTNANSKRSAIALVVVVELMKLKDCLSNSNIRKRSAFYSEISYHFALILFQYNEQLKM